MRTVISALMAVAALAAPYAPGAAWGKPARGGNEQAARARLAATTARPSLQASYLSPSGAFRLHYDTTGTRKVPLANIDGDRVPDWIELAAHVADSVLQAYGRMGYDTAVGDGGKQYDIYFLNLGTGSNPVYGLTYPGPDGYLEVDNDYSEGVYAGAWNGQLIFDSRGARGLRVTLAHELFHAVQFLYTAGPTDQWWMEMTATSMEEVMYDDINDYYQYLKPYWYHGTMYGQPAGGLDSYASGAVTPYSGAVFPICLRERFTDTAVRAIRGTFERERKVGSTDVAVIIGALQDTLGAKIQDLLADFWVWSYYTGSRARPEFFKEGANYSPAPLDSPYTDVSIPNLSTRHAVRDTVSTSHLGTYLLRIPPDGSRGGFTVKLTGLGTSQHDWAWRMAITMPNEVIALLQPSPFSPLQGDTATITLGPSHWEHASDIVLLGANGATAGTSIQFSYKVEYQPSTAIAAGATTPERAELGRNVPNPFNPSTTIPVLLDWGQPVTLVVYDMMGRPVRTLVRGDYLGPGEHRFTWDGRDEHGKPATSGVYFARLVTPAADLVRRMVLVR